MGLSSLRGIRAASSLSPPPAATVSSTQAAKLSPQPALAKLEPKEQTQLTAIRKRTLPTADALDALAALVLAGKLTPEEALLEVDPTSLSEMLLKTFEDTNVAPAAKGLGVSEGCASGVVIFEPAEAAERAARGEKVVLVIKQVTAEEVPAMKSAAGVICAYGGETSHTAVVARDFAIPAVNSEETFVVDRARKRANLGGFEVREGDVVSLDGRRGEIYAGARKVRIPAERKSFKSLLQWAKCAQGIDVWANADLPGQVERAFALGATGIGLVRTEHMFFGERLRVLQAAVLSFDATERAPFLDKLAAWQRQDFEGIFRAAQGRPVNIRLIDPPRHEVLPDIAAGDHVFYLNELAEALGVKRKDLERVFRTVFGEYAPTDVSRLFVRICKDTAEQTELGAALGGISAGEVRNAIAQLIEKNPMMGIRGVRLGVLAPDLYDMQVESIFRAAAACQADGIDAQINITLPMLGLGIDPDHRVVGEIDFFRKRIEAIRQRVETATSATLRYKLGAMVETPAAALNADLLAAKADYFSFGTNDLTQLTLGVDRENPTLVQLYRDAGLLKSSPFARLDPTLRNLIQVAISTGRSVRKDLSAGACGEQAADPESLQELQRAGCDYASVSPYRIPTALVASAQQRIRKQKT